MNKVRVYCALTHCLLCMLSFLASSSSAQQEQEFPLCTNETEIMSNATKRGVISSTSNHTFQFNGTSHCRIEFIGSGKERVKIDFRDSHYFALKEPLNSGFNGSDSEELDHNCSHVMQSPTAYDYNADGSLVEIQQYGGSMYRLPIMSTGTKMRLYIKAPAAPNCSFNLFYGTYSFVEDMGINPGKGGEQIPGELCKFEYKSWKGKDGSFHSPNYPGLYPRNVTCEYDFYGKENEVVFLNVVDFFVEGTPPCDDESHSDYVEFSDKRWNYGRLRLCGTITALHERSVGNFTQVTFRSNAQGEARGFMAKYRFAVNSGNRTNMNLAGYQLTIMTIAVYLWFLPCS